MYLISSCSKGFTSIYGNYYNRPKHNMVEAVISSFTFDGFAKLEVCIDVNASFMSRPATVFAFLEPLA